MEREDLRILELSNVSPRDSGVYRITLENTMGKIEASARLEVISHRTYSIRGLRARSSSPRPTTTYRRTYAMPSTRYGTNARLFSDIRDVPTAFLKYYKDTAPADEATKQDCFDECAPPRFIKELPKIRNVTEGGSLYLDLKVQGAEPFDVIWMKDGCVLPDCDEFRQRNEGDVISLHVYDTYLEDAGNYTCEVYNMFGEASSKCTVEVEGKWKIILAKLCKKIRNTGRF